MKYWAVLEHAEDDTWSAFVPDLPGCVATGATIEEARELMTRAVALHIESLVEHGESVPPPLAQAFELRAA